MRKRDSIDLAPLMTRWCSNTKTIHGWNCPHWSDEHRLQIVSLNVHIEYCAFTHIDSMGDSDMWWTPDTFAISFCISDVLGRVTRSRNLVSRPGRDLRRLPPWDLADALLGLIRSTQKANKNRLIYRSKQQQNNVKVMIIQHVDISYEWFMTSELRRPSARRSAVAALWATQAWETGNRWAIASSSFLLRS